MFASVCDRVYSYVSAMRDCTIAARKFKKYYSSQEEFRRFHCELKQIPCPHCGAIGALVLHGMLYGYSESSDNERIIRGRRIFCNNRKARTNGCGRTFSILRATVLRGFSISATSLWTFLKDITDLPDRLRSFRRLPVTLHESAAYRLWKRFVQGLSAIRSVLGRHCPRPKLPVARCAATQTIVHLRAVFKQASCPIAAFQERFQVSFL